MIESSFHESEHRARLGRFLQAEYGFRQCSLYPAPRGFFAETWRLTSTDETYFVKVDYSPTHQRHVQDGLRVLKLLRGQGIDFVPEVILTLGGCEHAQFGDAVVGVLRWCEGELTESDETKAMEYAMLARVYSTVLPDLTLHRAEFSNRSATTVRNLTAQVTDPTIAGLLRTHAKLLMTRERRLTQLADICEPNQTHFYLTHGDAGGNLLVSGARCSIVDWDEAQLAPPERDAWVWGHKPWARQLFDLALADVGIEYTLRSERLAYFAYHFWFFYLECFLAKHLETGQIPPGLLVYFDSEVDKRVRAADRCWAPGPLVPVAG